MKTLSIAIYVVLIVVLAAATVVERLYGTTAAHQFIYSAPWFYSLWAVLAMGGVYAIFRTHMWHRPVTLLLHVSFLVILLGALLTSLFSRQQALHLRQGETSTSELPFRVTLQRFQLLTYPGTDRPQDYVSHITYADGAERGSYTISMNHIFSHNGYRLYQTSYDEDLRGTWLTVKYDPWGVSVTYTGYALLFISMILLLLHPTGTFRKLLKESMSKGALVLLLLFSLSASAVPVNVLRQGLGEQSSEPIPVKVNVPVNTPRAITPERADTLARKQVVYNGRIAPLRTLALDFCQKVTGKRSFGVHSAQQLMLSIMLYPDDWQHVRLIKVEDETLRHSLGIEGRYASMTDFFNPDGTYRMSALYQRHKSTDDAMEKAILKVDERCALIVMLLRGELITTVPQGVERPSEALVTAELIYDAAPWSLILFIASFILAILSLLPFIFKRFPFPKTQKLSSTVIVVAKPRNVAKRIVASQARVSFLFPFPLTLSLATLYLLRWAIQGHIPLSNGYETMLFIALISSLFATFTSFRSHSLLSSLALIVTAFTLLVSHLSFMSPEMTPLMPVLQSPLLSIHVSVIMCAYALFALITLLSVVGLLSSHFSRFAGAHSELPPLRGIEGVLLYPAVFLLTTGIFLGAIWANVSWGTYWSWDPKETWALITLMIYAVPLHAESMPQFRNPRFYHLYMIFAFLSVLTTYFGVNYLLGGMHSYA